MKRGSEEVKKGAPAYMATYGDMMTLLLCFFVLLFAMSSLDEAKFRAFINSYSGATGILDGGQVILTDYGMLHNGIQQFPSSPNYSANEQALVEKNRALETIKEDLKGFIEANQLSNQVSVKKQGDAIVITLADVLLFESGKADLKQQAKEVLLIVGGELKTYIQEGYRIRMEGHTDNVPMHNAQFPSNWELSAARSIAVAKYFIYEMNFEPMRVSAEGFGEYKPIADNRTSEGKAMNRRVEIKLTKDH